MWAWLAPILACPRASLAGRPSFIRSRRSLPGYIGPGKEQPGTLLREPRPPGTGVQPGFANRARWPGDGGPCLMPWPGPPEGCAPRQPWPRERRARQRLRSDPCQNTTAVRAVRSLACDRVNPQLQPLDGRCPGQRSIAACQRECAGLPRKGTPATDTLAGEPRGAGPSPVLLTSRSTRQALTTEGDQVIATSRAHSRQSACGSVRFR